MVRRRQPLRPSKRNLSIIAAYKSGSTLWGVGGQFGITAERVRQILVAHGVASRFNRQPCRPAPQDPETRPAHSGPVRPGTECGQGCAQAGLLMRYGFCPCCMKTTARCAARFRRSAGSLTERSSFTAPGASDGSRSSGTPIGLRVAAVVASRSPCAGVVSRRTSMPII